MNEHAILKFPPGFLWGVSTSAYQIEGGINNDWSEWEKSRIGEKNSANHICGQACDSYNRYEEDLDLVKNLNCGAYRMGGEWGRVEPEQEKFNITIFYYY